MHKEWCGNSCSECKHPCALDESMPCSPDCECLGANGETDSAKCMRCDAKDTRDDMDITCCQNEVKERLWEIIRTAKYKEELCNSDGDVITSWYRPVVDGGLAMLLVDKLVESGVTFDTIASWKHRGDKNDFLWAECSNCGWRVENYKAVETGVRSTDYIGIKYKRCPKCEAKMVMNIDGG